ncbi:MAG: hypothetical protein LBQ88_12845 [Treponema sp.]|nr:hypothetical protein [Treponema sp.]
MSFIAVAAKSSEFDASKTDVFIAFLLFGMVVAAVFVVIGLVCRIIGTKKNLRILSSFNKFCTALVLLFLIITVFWPETYGLFDGNGWEIDYSLLAVIKALLPYCTALVLAVCVVLFFKKQFRHISPVLCVLTCVIFVLSPVTADGKVGSSEINSRLLSKSQNIIFIIWDGLPGIIADYIFEQNPPLKEDFRDFVFYPRAVTPYAQTYIAVPSIVGGIPASQEFDTEDNSALLKIFEETTILKKAEMAGYNLEPKQMGWYLGTPQTLQEIFLVRMASILYKCSTRVLPPHILNFGYEIKMRLSYPWKFQQARTVSILMEDIGIGYEQPVFYNLHCMVPHGPWLFTPDGKFTESGTILSDSEFSMNLMSMMLKRLKALGIYDNSLIVFWSDHGNQMQMRPMEGDSNLIRKYNEFVKWLPEYFSYQGNSRSDVGAHNPFLLIKYPYLQQENILIRNNPVATFYLYQFLEQALNTPDWESGTLTGVFDKIDGPIEVRLMHKEDYKDVWENHDNFNLMQTFELENGLESLPEIFNNLRPISEIK